jgi:hypothetical protein
VARGQQTDDSAAMYCRHAKKRKEKKRNVVLIRIHGIIHWDNIRKGHTVFAKECRKLGRGSIKSCKMLFLKD